MSVDIIDDENTDKSENIDNDTITHFQKDDNIAESLVAVEAVFNDKDLKILVTETKFQDQLRNKGFGEVFNSEYILNDLEALYLLNTGKLKLIGNREYDFTSLLKALLLKDKKILTRYLIYRDLRSKGYVVKNGFGFGNDFRIYDRGDYGKKPSKFVSIGINEGLNIKIRDFADIVEQIENMGKDAVIAVIERRGEVIYYKTNQMSFLENIKNTKKE